MTDKQERATRLNWVLYMLRGTLARVDSVRKLLESNINSYSRLVSLNMCIDDIEKSLRFMIEIIKEDNNEA